jgi:DNA-binding transcriptional LysR family regulator
MARIDLDLLHSFVVVVETGSLSAAAPRLFRSQSAVSEQIRKLEQTIGLPLLSRGKTGTTPTVAGMRLLDHARNLLALGEAAIRDVHGLQLEGELRLAITEYFRPSTITSILRHIRKAHPNLRLHVSIQKSVEIEGAVRAKDFDIGIPMRVIDSSRKPKMLASIRLAREPLHWVIAEAADFRPGRTLPLILLPETCSLHRLVTRELRRRKVDFYIAHTASSVIGAQQALLAGLGVTCLNESALPANVQILKSGHLPKMPDVEFALLAGGDSDRPLVTRVKKMLVEQVRGTNYEAAGRL